MSRQCRSFIILLLIIKLLEIVSKHNFLTRAMSTKYVESEARVISLVLIEGIAEVKWLLKAAKRIDVAS